MTIDRLTNVEPSEKRTSEYDDCQPARVFDGDDSPHIQIMAHAGIGARGQVRGRWIDATQPAEEIRKQIFELFNDSSPLADAAWYVNDTHGFAPLKLTGVTDIDLIAKLGSAILWHGPVFPGLVEHLGGIDQIARAEYYMSERYCGAYDEPGEFAGRLMREVYGDVWGKLPDFVRENVNLERVEIDLEDAGEMFTIYVDHVMHVFREVVKPAA